VKPDSDRLVMIDAAAIGIASAAICLFSRQLLFMTVFITAVFSGRCALVAALSKTENTNLKAEILFLLICTALGAFNDWNSVDRQGIYRYTVPHYFQFSTIPLWMLLFWGLILRFIARLARWERLGPPEAANNRVGIGRFNVESPVARLFVLLTLILATRLSIFRFWDDPLWSWLPFLLALLVFLAVCAPSGHDFLLLLICLPGGPLIEIVYIQLGGLHEYDLGWIGGVPLWIALWWLLAVLVWKDLAYRLEAGLRRICSKV
jgi:hypothetical protein